MRDVRRLRGNGHVTWMAVESCATFPPSGVAVNREEGASCQDAELQRPALQDVQGRLKVRSESVCEGWRTEAGESIAFSEGKTEAIGDYGGCGREPPKRFQLKQFEFRATPRLGAMPAR
jgi:hypothetical protein